MGERIGRRTVVNVTAPGKPLAVGHTVEITQWEADTDNPQVKLPLPTGPAPQGREPRVWTSPDDGTISDEIAMVPTTEDVMVWRVTILKPVKYLRLSSKIKSIAVTKDYVDVKYPATPLPLTPSIVLGRKVTDGLGGILVGVLIDGAPTTIPLLVQYGLAANIDGIGDFFVQPKDVGGTNRSNTVLVSPSEIPGMPDDTRLGPRFLMQRKPGPWSGQVYATVYATQPNGEYRILGVARQDIVGPL